MKIIYRSFYTVLLFPAAIITHSQSIEIGNGAELNVGTNADICATNWGNISGNITGSGTQCDGVLPVELISFTAFTEAGRNVKLTWVTSSEMNNRGFEIERKALDGVWVKAGWVNGIGNSGLPIEYNFTDAGLNMGVYHYRLKQIDYNGGFEYFLLENSIEIKAPGIFSLSQNYPNPSNPFSNIEYQIPLSATVIIKVYDITGRELLELVNKNQEAGYYKVRFEGSNLASGVYFYSISAAGENGTFTATKKLLLVK